MKTVSVNISSPKEVQWNGKTITTGIFKKPVNHSILLQKNDVKNDAVIDRKYHGGIDKACYAFGVDSYSEWQKKYPDADWEFGAFGENLTVEGLDENSIQIGSIYEVGEALVQVSQPRQPCFKLGIRIGTQKILKDFMKVSFSGMYLRVLKEGAVNVGDTWKLMDTPCGNLTVADVHSLFAKNKDNQLLAKLALKEKTLAKDYKDSIARSFKISQ